MFLYENEKCPVCSRPFEKGDDVVTCPECGTPHHRECYKDYGGCKNRSLHGSDFIYRKGEQASGEEDRKNLKRRSFLSDFAYDEEEEQGEYYVPKNEETIENTEADEKAEEIEETVPEVSYTAESADEIDGVKVDDIASVVAVNAVKFIPKFKRNRLLNWNWSAFFFGSFYYFFRKMHIQGAVFTAIEYGIRLAITAAFLPAMIAFEKAIAEVKTMTDYYAAFANFMTDPEYQNFMLSNVLLLVALFVIRVLCALLADSFYRKKVINVVKTVDEKVKMGESFSVMGPFVAMESNMSQKDMRRIFLSRQGGVSTMAPLLAIIIIQLLLNLLNAF